MACSGFQGDYLCAGWRLRAAAVVARDGGRCRGCDRGAGEVRLEVHHRRYGRPGSECGACILTGVADEDLVTLCGGPGGCHEAITNVRRAARYADKAVDPAVLAAPAVAARVMVAARVEITAEPLEIPAARTAVPVRRADLW